MTVAAGGYDGHGQATRVRRHGLTRSASGPAGSWGRATPRRGGLARGYLRHGGKAPLRMTLTAWCSTPASAGLTRRRGPCSSWVRVP